MANDRDDDLLDAAIPEPEAEASPSERAHAKTFADLVDKTLAGRSPRLPVMNADDRALLEAATMIRAAHGKAELPAARQHAMIEDALRAAIGGKGAGSEQPAGVVPIERARARRWAPWAIAATSTLVAVAAILMLWLQGPKAASVPAAAAAVPATWKSRPADALVGPIARERAGDASARIDTIFADRLDGYRERRLRGGKP